MWLKDDLTAENTKAAKKEICSELGVHVAKNLRNLRKFTTIDVGATGWSPMPQPKREFNRRERKGRKEDFSMCPMRSMWLKDDLTAENVKAAKSLCSMRSLRL